MMKRIHPGPVGRTSLASALVASLAVALAACTGDSGAAAGQGSAGGEGTGTVTFAGEQFEVRNVRCREAGGSNFYGITANGPGNAFVQVRFNRMDPFSEYVFDRGSIRYDMDPGFGNSRMAETLSGSETHATGWVEIDTNPLAPEDDGEGPVRVEIDLRCD